jgi:hypothetical protein
MAGGFCCGFDALPLAHHFLKDGSELFSGLKLYDF